MPAPPDLRIEPEYQPDFDAWKATPTPATAGKLIRTIKPELDRAIHSYVGVHDPVIFGHAKRLALTALPKYDPAQTKLGTYMMSQLQGLRRKARQQQQIISIPERVQTDSAYLRRTEADLSDTLGRDPSTQELSSASGLSAKRIAHVRSFRYPIAEGQLISHNEDGEEQSPEAVGVDADNGKTWRQIVYMDADPVDQKILEWSFGMHGAEAITPTEMAVRLGISPPAVSQRRAKLQRMLDQEQELSPL